MPETNVDDGWKPPYCAIVAAIVFGAASSATMIVCAGRHERVACPLRDAVLVPWNRWPCVGPMRLGHDDRDRPGRSRVERAAHVAGDPGTGRDRLRQAGWQAMMKTILVTVLVLIAACGAAPLPGPGQGCGPSRFACPDGTCCPDLGACCSN